MHGPGALRHDATTRLLLFLLLIIALTIPAPPVFAQGARGILPDPISHGDVERYADAMNASPPQREALARIHDAYLAEFRALRDGPIERFLSEHPRAVSFYARIPADPSVADEEARGLDHLAGRVRRLDDAFFGRMQEILTEEQAAGLPPVKRSRQRTRLRQGSALVTGSPYLLTDLAILFDELQLDPQARQAARPLVEDYERKLLAALKRLDDVTSALGREMLEQRRLNEQAIREQALWPAAIVLRAIFEKLAVLTGEVGDAHRQALAQWRAVLPQSASDELERRFCAIVYPEAPADLGPARELFQSILDDESLDGETRASIEAQRQLFRDSAGRIKNRMFDVIDALRASTAAHPIQFSSGGDGATYYEDRAAYDDRLAELRGELDELNQSAARALAAITGEPREIPHIAVRKPKEPGAGLSIGVGAPRGADGPRVYSYRQIPLEQLVLQFGSGAARFLPDPIPAEDLGRYARRLNLGEDDQPVLAALHETYLDRFRDLGGEGPIGRVRRLQRTLFQRDATGRVELPSIRQMEELCSLRRRALRAILAIDAQFHDDLFTVWGDEVAIDVFDRLKRDRLRAVYRRAGPGEAIPGVYRPLVTIGPRELAARADAESIALELDAIIETACPDLHRAQSAEIRAIVAEAEIGLTELLEDLFEARFEMELERARLLASRLERDGQGALMATQVQATDAMIHLDERIHQGLLKIRAHNQAARDALASRLPESARWAFLAAYRRAGHPGVYEDAQRMHHALGAARRLEDLDARQRGNLDELARTYHIEYEAICQRITAAIDDRQARSRHEAERDELNERIRSRLRALLNQQQLAEIGLGP